MNKLMIALAILVAAPAANATCVTVDCLMRSQGMEPLGTSRPSYVERLREMSPEPINPRSYVSEPLPYTPLISPTERWCNARSIAGFGYNKEREARDCP